MTLTQTPPTEAQSSAATPAPIRVCHVSLTLKTGGLERILADLSRHHDRDRCQAEFLAIHEVGRFADEIRSVGATVRQLKSGGRWSQIQQMVRLFRSRKFDVVHTHNTYPHIYASIAARLAGVPVVVNTRHGQRAGHGWKSRTQFRWVSHLVDRIIAVSDDAMKLCIEADGIPGAKVLRVWNGIDLSDFIYRGPAKNFTAISVARLSHEKDFGTLIAAVHKVVSAVPEFKLQIVGDGPERQKLESQARELGLGPHVEFLGERTDIPSLLAGAAFFVTSSLTEGISLTLLEAMAVGLPIVATSVGGNPEIVVANETGLLVPAQDVDKLADAMISMSQSAEVRTQMGRAGCNRVAEHFDVQRMARDYEQIYSELLAEKRHNR
jgi:sugar transferase (PEP-CTERM/EpsH1 system associated)